MLGRLGIALRFPHVRARGPREQRGAAAVELALVLPLLLLLLFGIIQYGIYFFSMQAGSAAAREAVRRVAVGDCPSDAQLKTYVQTRLGGASVGNLNVSRTFVDDSNNVVPPTVGGQVKIMVQFDAFNLHFPLIPVPNGGQVIKRVQAIVEDTTDGGTCA